MCTRLPHPRLSETIAARIDEFGTIDGQRSTSLRELADHVTGGIAYCERVRLVFICTHNSRRSQMAEIWARTAATHFGVAGVETYSGGTEATAFDPRAVAAMQRAGFSVESVDDGANPIYNVRFSDTDEPMEAFSKVYDQPPNPTSHFAAVMTCSEADTACPLVTGAHRRFTITYQDPRAFDGTDREAEAYDARCRQIAREMLFTFSQVRT